MARDATHTLKLGRYDAHAKMCFAGTIIDLMMATIFVMMACMEVAFIYDFKPFREKAALSLASIEDCLLL